MKKRIFATVLTIALMFSLSGVCFAAESVFSEVPIDSNNLGSGPNSVSLSECG